MMDSIHDEVPTLESEPIAQGQGIGHLSSFVDRGGEKAIEIVGDAYLFFVEVGDVI